MTLDSLREDADRIFSALGARRGPMFFPSVRDMRPNQERWMYLIIGPGGAVYDWDWGAKELVTQRAQVSLSQHSGSRARLFRITEIGAPF